MSGSDKKCPACGAGVSFNLETEMWECSSCSGSFSFAEIEEYNNKMSSYEVSEAVNDVSVGNNVIENNELVLQSVNNEFQPVVNNKSVDDIIQNEVPATTGDDIDDMDDMSFAAAMSEALANSVESNAGSSIYHCNGCGVEFMTNEGTDVSFCIYCGSTSMSKDDIEAKLPDYIMPFKTTKEFAVLSLKKLFKGRILVPRCFRTAKTIEKITGVYIPFWAYDLETNGEVEFEAWDTMSRKDANYKYFKVDRYSVRKSGHFDFDKILVNGSTKFPRDLVDLLEPFDYSQLIPYKNSHLANFLLEKYDISENAGMITVRDKVNEAAIKIMERTVGHQSRKVINNGLRVTMRRAYHIMLPVWFLNVKYKDTNYTFAMNGQTGEVIGDLPIGIKETIIWSIIFFVVLFFVGIGFMWLLWG